jgi:hypothetical protein
MSSNQHRPGGRGRGGTRGGQGQPAGGREARGGRDGGRGGRGREASGQAASGRGGGPGGPRGGRLQSQGRGRGRNGNPRPDLDEGADGSDQDEPDRGAVFSASSLQLLRQLRNTRTSVRDYTAWRKLWEEVSDGAGDIESLHCLRKGLLATPMIRVSAPQPTHVIKYLERVCTAPLIRKMRDDEGILRVSEVLGCLVYLSPSFGFAPPSRRIEISNALKRLEGFLSDMLYLLCKANVRRFSGELTKVTDIIDRLQQNIASLGDDGGSSDAGEEPPYLGWRGAATVDWLMSRNWRGEPQLRDKYATVEEYQSELLKMWSALTFYWGAGALWAKCQANGQSGDMRCGEPLLHCLKSTTGRGRGATCSRKDCRKEASWSCIHHNHDSICDECLLKEQDQCCGASGSRGVSTDIYDAIVSSERDGCHFFKQVKSRKPPQKEPNWKTTYRLVSPALVAIVVLERPGERLRRSQELLWAEVVPHDHKMKRDEWRRRGAGEVAIRLLGCGDCVGFRPDSELHLPRDHPIAIIDLRVFVPEVLSVLNTLSKDFGSNLEDIYFSNNLLGCGGSTGVPVGLAFDAVPSTAKAIEYAIKHSEISLVVDLKPNEKRDYINRLLSVDTIQKLRGTQLEAFVESLRCPVHCTQGPPGTGKVSRNLFVNNLIKYMLHGNFVNIRLSELFGRLYCSSYGYSARSIREERSRCRANCSHLVQESRA